MDLWEAEAKRLKKGLKSAGFGKLKLVGYGNGSAYYRAASKGFVVELTLCERKDWEGEFGKA